MSVEIALRHRHGNFTLDVAFAVEKPGITALFGPSGAGKTTLINAVAGLLRPIEGRIAIGDRVLFDSAANIWLGPRQRRVGYVFQDARLFPHMSVESNLRFGWRRTARRLAEDEVARVVEMLGLGALLHRKPAKLSGGEKGRVSLGRALLANPDVLLLDEPLAALDQARKNEILPWLERLRDEVRIPMLYVSHSLDEVSRLANDIVILRNGRVAAAGSVFDVLADLRLPDFTGGSPYGAVLDTVVHRHSTGDGLTVLAFAGGELSIPLLQRPQGMRLRTHIRAEDVMLANERPVAISANNVLPAIVSGIRASDNVHVDVQLRCGASAIVARITRASCTRLGLHEGMNVFAIVKSVTVAPQVEAPNSVSGMI
jgi:molybdate transport system ATP-binding protein